MTRVLPSVGIPGGGAGGIARADIVVAGLDHGGDSFELRIFLNNPGADAETEPVAEAGYAGSIHVYGHGRPGGEPQPTTRYVMATEAVRSAAAAGPTAAVTLVAVPYSTPTAAVDLDGVEVAVMSGEGPPATG